MGYLTNFIVYTLAMVGVIVVALLVFKNTSGCGVKKGSKFLKVVDTMSLGPRKTLYVISAGDEKFLIAGDVDKTNLISKLESSEHSETKRSVDDNFKQVLSSMPAKTSYMDKSAVGIYSTQKKPYDSVMKNLAERIRQ